MKYAPASLPDAPAGGVSAGIDWASEDHAVCVVDAAGEVVTRFAVEHAAAGLRDLVQRLARAGVAEVAIERGDGPVVDALLGAGLTVVVITPGQVKNLRSRYGAAGNKDDRFDAYVLRTDRARLRPLPPVTNSGRGAVEELEARAVVADHAVCASGWLSYALQARQVTLGQGVRAERYPKGASQWARR